MKKDGAAKQEQRRRDNKSAAQSGGVRGGGQPPHDCLQTHASALARCNSDPHPRRTHTEPRAGGRRSALVLPPRRLAEGVPLDVLGRHAAQHRLFGAPGRFLVAPDCFLVPQVLARLRTIFFLSHARKLAGGDSCGASDTSKRQALAPPGVKKHGRFWRRRALPQKKEKILRKGTMAEYGAINLGERRERRGAGCGRVAPARGG